MVPVAQASDQPFWGSLVQRQGVGRQATAVATKMTAAQLAADLKKVLDVFHPLKQAAVQMAQQMERHGGQHSAVELIKGMLPPET